MNYLEIIERAECFLAEAPANQVSFTKYGLTEQFFADLTANVAAFRDVSQGQADAKRTGVGATADVEAILQDTLDNRKELDRAIKNHYRNNPQKLAEWLTASHIERRKTVEPKPTENDE